MSGLQNSQNPALADYNWRAFAFCLRARHGQDGRGLRAIADEIGVTATDLSRAMGGQIVSVAKVISLAEWAGVEVKDFYLPPLLYPMKSDRCTGSNVKHRVVAQ